MRALLRRAVAPLAASPIVGARPAGIRLPVALIAAAVTLAAWPAQSAPLPPFHAGAPAVRTLPNGLRVAVFARPRLPIVEIALRLPAGVADEPAAASGVANATVQLVTQGTSSRTAAQYLAEIERLGGTVSGSAGRDYATLTGAFRAQDFDAGLELLADAALHAVFGEADLERVKNQTLSALAQLDANPYAAAEQELWASTLRGHPYAHPLFGTPEGVAALGADAVRSFYRQHYRPQGAVLVIAGDVTADKAFAAAGEWFGAWTGAATPASVPAAPAPARTLVRVIDRPGPVAEVRIGLAAPARTATDGPAMDVVSRMLSTRLSALGRGLTSTHVALAHGGMLSLAAGTRADSAGAMIAALRGELTRLARSAPAAAEITAAQRALAGQWQLPFETLDALIGEWLVLDFDHSGGADLDAYPVQVGAVPSSDVAAAIARWVHADPVVIVAVGPARMLRPQLARFGTVEVVGGVSTAQQTPSAPLAAMRAATPEQRRRGRLLVAQAIAAHGGLARLQKVGDSVMQGSMIVLTPEGREMTGQLQQVRKEPMKMLLETTFMGFTTQQVLDGRHGWSRFGGDSVVVADADSATLIALRSGFTADIVHLLLAANDPRASVASRGPVTVGGRSLQAVDVGTPGAAPRRLYFDPVSHRLAAMDQNELQPGSGTYSARRTYKDYRQVGGIWWPYVEERLLAGRRVMTLTLKRVAVNTGIEDAAFRRPAGPEPSSAR